MRVGLDHLKRKLPMFSRLVDDLMQISALRPYPIREIDGFTDNKDITLFIKPEHDNGDGDDPLRTVKRKPATMMGIATEELNPNRKVWISASSGNFVAELGILANKLNKKVIAVVPPRMPYQKLKDLLSLGLDVVKVTREEYDLCPREFTVFWVRAITHMHAELVNVDQYNSLLNPLSHFLMTSQEIANMFGKDLTHIFVPLGSAGTLAGISEYFSRFYPNVNIIGVQPTKDHHVPGVHYVTGDCKWSPEIFELPHKQAIKVLTIDDKAAYKAMIELDMKYGIHCGPSTGMVFAAIKQEVKNISSGNILFLSADSSWSYREWNETILTDAEIGIHESIEKQDLNRYLEILEGRGGNQSRLERIRRIYNPPSEGRLYSLEDFEELLDKSSLG